MPSTYTQDDLAQAEAYFRANNLESLWSKAYTLITQGYTDVDTILWKLREEPEYKQRFSANAERKAKNLPELSPREYIQMERQYRDFMKSAGLPSGFYDSIDDFKSWIGNDVSVAEASDRVQRARDAVLSADGNVKSALKQFYGVDENGMVAYLLDPAKATSLLEKQYRAAKWAGAASRQGATVSQALAEQAAAFGFSDEQANMLMQRAAEDQASATRLAEVYKEKLSADDVAAATFGMDGEASKKVKKLASQERATFGGSSGTGRGSLSRSTSGQL